MFNDESKKKNQLKKDKNTNLSQLESLRLNMWLR